MIYEREFMLAVQKSILDYFIFYELDIGFDDYLEEVGDSQLEEGQMPSKYEGDHVWNACCKDGLFILVWRNLDREGAECELNIDFTFEVSEPLARQYVLGLCDVINRDFPGVGFRKITECSRSKNFQTPFIYDYKLQFYFAEQAYLSSNIIYFEPYLQKRLTCKTNKTAQTT